MRQLAFALVAALAAAATMACGDGGTGASPGSPTRPAGTATAPSVLVAAGLIPDLTGQGFNQTVPETIPNTGQLDIAFTIYEKPGPPQLSARAEVRVYPSEETAANDFKAQAQGWKTPPPGLFGGDPGNLDGPALEGLDDAVGYIASNRDPQGFRLWTDVYRIGRVIVVAHVLGQNEADVNPVRRAISEGVAAKLR